MDDNQITIIRALDDADVCGKAALERLGALTTGIDDIRREFLLWTWLRMRSYARHAAVTAYGNINKSEFKDAGLARWREAIQPLIEAHAIENQLKERKFFEGDWVGNDLKSQMKEREVNKRIDDLYSNPVMWLDEEKLKDDELAECREVVRLRTEFRAICAEIESVRGWSPRDPYIVNNGDLIEFRRSDGKLEAMVKESTALKSCAADLVIRFYTPINVRMDSVDQKLLNHFFSIILNKETFPWLKGEEKGEETTMPDRWV